MDSLFFDYAFRNYLWKPLATWAHKHGTENRYWPLGPMEYSGPIKGAQKLASTRQNLCFFAGAPTHGDRKKMLAFLQSSKMSCSVTNIRGAKYSQQLADTVFALTPWGNNPETFRFWEALEHGAIPIMVRIPDDSDFAGYTGIPYLALDSWSELDSVLGPFAAEFRKINNALEKNSNGVKILGGSILDDLQQKVVLAYRAFIEKTQKETALVIENSFLKAREKFL